MSRSGAVPDSEEPDFLSLAVSPTEISPPASSAEAAEAPPFEVSSYEASSRITAFSQTPPSSSSTAPSSSSTPRRRPAGRWGAALDQNGEGGFGGDQSLVTLVGMSLEDMNFLSLGFNATHAMGLLAIMGALAMDEEDALSLSEGGALAMDALANTEGARFVGFAERRS